MKIKVLVLLISISFMTSAFASTNENITATKMIKTDSLLRHTVFFKFKEGTTPAQIKQVEDAFSALPSKEDRAIYLPHPDHKAFGAVLTPHLEDVFVVDFWIKN